MTATILAAIGRYARQGWPVFPCHSTTPGRRCSCGAADCASPGKHPRINGWQDDATTDERQLQRWWRQWPDANPAIVTGASSGLVVLDIDPRHNGDRNLADELRRRRVELPDTLTVRTGGGGTHHYYRHPGTHLPNTANRITLGVDTRGDGGYVLAPPSRHASGHTYQWAAAAPIVPLPPWMHDALTPTPSPRSTTPNPPLDCNRWADAALRAELNQVRTAAEGTRNNTLNRAAFKLGQLVAAGLLPELNVHHDLISAATTAGLSAREARATIASGLTAGARNPRYPSTSSDDRVSPSRRATAQPALPEPS